jgi:hypothetical protein
MFPLPHKNALKYRTRQNCERHVHLNFQSKMYQGVPHTFCRVRYSESGYTHRKPAGCNLRAAHFHLHTKKPKKPAGCDAQARPGPQVDAPHWPIIQRLASRDWQQHAYPGLPANGCGRGALRLGRRAGWRRGGRGRRGGRRLLGKDTLRYCCHRNLTVLHSDVRGVHAKCRVHARMNYVVMPGPPGREGRGGGGGVKCDSCPQMYKDERGGDGLFPG